MNTRTTIQSTVTPDGALSNAESMNNVGTPNAVFTESRYITNKSTGVVGNVQKYGTGVNNLNI